VVYGGVARFGGPNPPPSRRGRALGLVFVRPRPRAGGEALIRCAAVRIAEETMRHCTILATIAFAALAAGVPASAVAEPASPPAPRAPAVVYAQTCGYCHGANVGPVILGRALPAPMITATVRAGRGAMPAFRPTEISDGELSALAAWIAASPAAQGEHGK